MNKNLFIGAGRVAADPKFFEGEGGDSTKDRLLFTLMVNRPKSERADAIPIICWDKQARAGVKYINKGKTLLVEGTVSTYYDREKQTNHIQIRANSIDYGPKTNKTQVADVAPDGPVDDLAAKLAAKARGGAAPDQKLALIDKLVTEHKLDYAEAKKLAEEHFQTAPKAAEARPGYDDCPF